MTNYTGQGLSRTKKVLLAGAGIAALAGPIVVGVLIGIGNMRKDFFPGTAARSLTAASSRDGSSPDAETFPPSRGSVPLTPPPRRLPYPRRRKAATTVIA